MRHAPIALFTYRRLWHTTQTVVSLQQNLLASDSDLFVFSDGPRDERAHVDVAAVRKYLGTIVGFRSVTVVEREHNLGLATSITSGVTDLIGSFGRAIVVEDDLVSSPHFLSYMNDGLDFYQNDDRIVSIHAYSYPVEEALPETFFLRGADCWGWATWKRGWDLFEPDGRKLYRELKRRQLLRDFDFGGAYAYSRMLWDQIHGRNDSWAVRWYASAFLRDKLTLYPGRSLVQNIGFDGSGTHCKADGFYDCQFTNDPIQIIPIDVCDHPAARAAITRFLSRSRPSLAQRIRNHFGWLRRRNRQRGA